MGNSCLLVCMDTSSRAVWLKGAIGHLSLYRGTLQFLETAFFITSSLFIFIIKCLGLGRWLNWEPEFATKNPYKNPTAPIVRRKKRQTILWKLMDLLGWHVQQPTTNCSCLKESARWGLLPVFLRTYMHAHTCTHTPDTILVFKSTWEDRWKNWWSGSWWSGALRIVPEVSIPGSLFLFHHDDYFTFFYKWKNSISDSKYYFRYYILPGWSILMTKK